jgi:ABC-type branched-subunit amino acid transport system substrate-binding protein
MYRKGLSITRRSISTVIAVVIVVVIIIVAVAGGVLYLSSLTKTSNNTTSSGSTIQIVFGATLSMSGQFQPFGTEQNWTLYQAVSDINSYGGIPLKNGSHAMVKLIVLNDQSDASTASSNLNTLVSTDHAIVILGELGGVQDATAQTFATSNQIPYIGPVYISQFKSCSSGCPSNWIFAPFENETNEAHVFLNWFHKINPTGTIAFFGEGDPAAAANNQAGEAYAQKLGYTVCTCSDTSFSTGSTSEMNTFIQAAKSAGAIAVYGLPNPPDAQLMATTAKNNGYAPKAWLLTRGTAVGAFTVTAAGGVGNDSQGFMSAFPWQPLVPYNGTLIGHIVSNSKLVSEYEAYWHIPPTLEGVYYTEALVAADAIENANNLTNFAIRQALVSGTFQTPMGTVSFTPGGQWIQSDSDILLMQWQPVTTGSGVIQELQTLEPSSINTTSYVYYPFTWPTSSEVKLACPSNC